MLQLILRTECAGMWEQGIDDLMHALVAGDIRMAAAAMERQTHIGAFHGDAVLTVVEQRYTETGLGDVRPLVVADLKLCRLNGGVAGGGTVNVAELDLMLCGGGHDIHVEADL